MQITPVQPDPAVLFPLVCIVAGVDLGSRLPVRGGVTLEDVPAEEVRAAQERTGISIEPGTGSSTGNDDCPPEEDTETTTTTTVGGQVTTTRTVKVVNPDGTVTTTTTTTKPDGTQSVQIDTETGTPARPAGVLIRLRLENGAEFSLIRPLTKLRVGDACTVIENFSDRHALRAWVNAVVHAPPRWAYKHHARGAEFYTLDLELLVIGGTP